MLRRQSSILGYFKSIFTKQKSINFHISSSRIGRVYLETRLFLYIKSFDGIRYHSYNTANNYTVYSCECSVRPQKRTEIDVSILFF